MKLFIFLIFLAVAYGHHGDPDLHEDQNCSQKCQDQCFPCENLCREQTLSGSQDCQACQGQCQQCLTMCHNGDPEDGVIVDNEIQPIRNFLSMDRCNMCKTQCSTCKLKCHFGSDCEDCEQICERCNDFCHSRSKRHDYDQKQPMPSCEEKCASLCLHDKSEDCENCLRECEGDQDGQEGNVQDKSQQDGGRGDQQLIPLGSCRKCMNYCNLCEVQCQNSRLGQPKCDRCHERCSQCREMCSPESRSKRDMGNPTCQDQCRPFCSIGKNQACQDCMEQCEQGDGQEQLYEQGGNEGNEQENRKHARSVDQGDEQIEDHGQLPISQDCQRCRELCAHGTGKHCSDCLNRCHGVGQVQPDGQGDHGHHENLMDSNCQQRCDLICRGSRQQSKECQKCWQQCEQQAAHGPQNEQDGSLGDGQGDQGHHQDEDCLQKCQGVCTSRRGISLEGCQNCLNQCQQENQSGQQQGRHNPRCQACKLGCNFCFTHCQSQGDNNCEHCRSSCSGCKEICQGQQDHGTREKRNTGRCEEMCQGVCHRDSQGQGCQQCLQNCRNDEHLGQDHGDNQSIGLKHGQNPECRERCQAVCQKDQGQKVEKSPECKECFAQCRQESNGERQKEGQDQDKTGCRAECRQICAKFGHGQQCRECFSNCRQGGKDGQEQDLAGQQNCTDCTKQCRACVAHNHHLCSGDDHEQIAECVECRETCGKCRDRCK